MCWRVNKTPCALHFCSCFIDNWTVVHSHNVILYFIDLIGLSIWLSSHAIFNTLFWVYVNYFHEKMDKTRKYSKSAIFVWYENGRWRLLGAQSINTERVLTRENIFDKIVVFCTLLYKRYCLRPTAGDCGCVLPKLFCVWRHWRGRVQQSDVRTWPFHYCDGMRFSIIYKNPPPPSIVRT